MTCTGSYPQARSGVVRGLKELRDRWLLRSPGAGWGQAPGAALSAGGGRSVPSCRPFSEPDSPFTGMLVWVWNRSVYWIKTRITSRNPWHLQRVFLTTAFWKIIFIRERYWWSEPAEGELSRYFSYVFREGWHPWPDHCRREDSSTDSRLGPEGIRPTPGLRRPHLGHLTSKVARERGYVAQKAGWFPKPVPLWRQYRRELCQEDTPSWGLCDLGPSASPEKAQEAIAVPRGDSKLQRGSREDPSLNTSSCPRSWKDNPRWVAES